MQLNTAEKANLLLTTVFTQNNHRLLELYKDREALARLNIYAAAAVADTEKVSEFIQADKHLAIAIGGPKQAAAITYAAHAQLHFADPGFKQRQLHTVCLLLNAGADPNASTMANEQGEGALSALYGCTRAKGNPELAEMLLDAGATTDDNESLYHASELADTRVLELLFAKGLNPKDQEFSIGRVLDFDYPKGLEVFLKNKTNPHHLAKALFRNRCFECIELLVKYGADVNLPSAEDGMMARVKDLTPVQIAERNGAADIVDFLLTQGAIDNRAPIDQFIGASQQGDRDKLNALLTAHPQLMTALQYADHQVLPSAAREGKITTVKLLLDHGFDIEARSDDLNATALNYAACNGNLSMIRLLLAYQPDLTSKNSYGGDPLDAAIYCAKFFCNPTGDYPGVVNALIKAGCTPEKQYLTFAIEHELIAIADVLKSWGVAI